MMNQQSQNFSQGNAGGNTTVTALYQYQQQRAQQHQNHAVAAHLRAQANLNGNQQHFSQQQTRQPLNVNANGLQGLTPAHMTQLRAVQQQMQANLAAQQQTIQASMKVNQHQQQQQHQQQRDVQAPVNMNQQQQQQQPRQQIQPIQQADNPAAPSVINDLVSQLKSINEKLEVLSSPNKSQPAAGSDLQPERQNPPSKANNNVSNDAQASRPASTVGQPAQKKAPPIPAAHTTNANANTNTSRLSAEEILQRYRHVPAKVTNQPLRSAPQTGAVANTWLHHGQPQTSAVTAGQYARQIAQQIQPRVLPSTTQQIHRPNNPPANAAKKTVNINNNPKQRPRPTLNGQTKTSANGEKQSYIRKQPPIAPNKVAGLTVQNVRPPVQNTKPQQKLPPAPQARQNVATSALAPGQPPAATSRQDPNMITSIRILSYKMGQIVRHVPQELADAYSKLSHVQKFTLENTMVFKFENRARKPKETGENTPQAIFFLNKLQTKSSLVQRKLKLVGLKCNLCNLRDAYVVGSTSFVDVENPRTQSLFSAVIKSRTNHMLSCPDCKPTHKAILRTYAPTVLEIQNLNSFAEKWLLVAKASFFDVPLNTLLLVPAAPPQQQKTQVIEQFLPITEDSIYEDLVSSMEMGKAMGDLHLDDLTEGMEKLLSPVMEVFLMSFRLQSNEQAGIELCCKDTTSAENSAKLLVWSFEKPFSVDDDFCKRIWGFFQQHYKTCSYMPNGIQKLVCSSIQPPMEELKFVGKKWSDYASRIVRNQKLIQPKSDVKIMRPMYIATPLEYVPARKSGTFRLQGNFDDNDVVMIGAYRDFIGNRRFRQTVSQFRALYSKLPPNKQSFITEKTIALIQRRGGSFYSKDGYLARLEDSFAYTEKALQYGFPEMMCPVIPAEAKSVVWDVEFTRMVDILPDRKESINRVKKIMVESLSKPRDFGTLDRRPPPSNKEGQSSANPPPSSEVVDLTKGNSKTEKSAVREGHPIDISALKQLSLLNAQKALQGSGKRKQDRPSTGDASKRPRKST